MVHMSRLQKFSFATVLFVLAVSFGGGVALGSAHLAVATFLSVSALFLGCIAGLALLSGAIRLDGSPANKALFSLSGLLLTGAMLELALPPLGSLVRVGESMFFAGAALGILSVLMPRPCAATAGRAAADRVRPRAR